MGLPDRIIPLLFSIMLFGLTTSAPADENHLIQMHFNLESMSNQECLECHGDVTPDDPEGHPAHGIHLKVLTKCSECHKTVDVRAAVSEPDKTQVSADVCYQCHEGQTAMVRMVLEVSHGAKPKAGGIGIADLAKRQPLPHEGDFVGSETCGDCHEEIYQAWEIGRHASAMKSAIFSKDWESKHFAQACLRCHTTGYNPETGDFAFQGVGCEVCHGPMSEGHPDDAPHLMDIDASLCGNCHPDQWREWSLSKHAGADIQCRSCHDPHSQKLRFETVQELCGACHEDRGETFAHSTHASNQVKCSSCHMRPEASSGKAGHTFTVGSEACIRCHRDEIHARDTILTLASEAETLRALPCDELQHEVIAQKEELESLRNTRSRSRGIGIFMGLLIGLTTGGFAAWTAAHRFQQEPDDDKEE